VLAACAFFVDKRRQTLCLARVGIDKTDAAAPVETAFLFIRMHHDSVEIVGPFAGAGLELNADGRAGRESPGFARCAR